MEWLEKALCKGYHSDLWFPPLFKEERSAPESHYHEIAKMVCEQCPVLDQCRKLGAAEELGVWGGTTPKERSTVTWKPTKKVLPKTSIRYVIPKQAANTHLDIPTLRTALKSYTERRVTA